MHMHTESFADVIEAAYVCVCVCGCARVTARMLSAPAHLSDGIAPAPIVPLLWMPCKSSAIITFK